jgi:hypothetical protein
VKRVPGNVATWGYCEWRGLRGGLTAVAAQVESRPMRTNPIVQIPASVRA